MKRLLLLVAIATVLLSQTYAQTVPDYQRTIMRGNQAIVDDNLSTAKALRIPVASSWTLNGAKDVAGYIMYNTTLQTFGIYKGGGVWYTFASSDLSGYISRIYDDTNIRGKKRFVNSGTTVSEYDNTNQDGSNPTPHVIVGNGAQGNVEWNAFYNMDYSDGTHQYYNPNYRASWLAMHGNFFGMQVMPANVSGADKWAAAGSPYAFTFIRDASSGFWNFKNYGNIEATGRVYAANGLVAPWSTSTRPAGTYNINLGAIGYNTDTTYPEYYNGAAWVSLVPQSGTKTIDGLNTFTGSSTFAGTTFNNTALFKTVSGQQRLYVDGSNALDGALYANATTLALTRWAGASGIYLNEANTVNALTYKVANVIYTAYGSGNRRSDANDDARFQPLENQRLSSSNNVSFQNMSLSGTLAVAGKASFTVNPQINTSSVAGQVWTATDAVGNGSWQSPTGSGGALGTPTLSGGGASVLGNSFSYSISGNNVDGIITLNTGSATGTSGYNSGAGYMFTVTFGNSVTFSNDVSVILTSGNDHAASDCTYRMHTNKNNNNGFQILLAGGPLQALTTYKFNYHAGLY